MTDPCEPYPLFGKVSFLHFHRFCVRYVSLLTDLTIRDRLSSSRVTRLHRYYAIIRLPVSRLPSSRYYCLSGILASLQDETGSPGLPSILNLQHAMLSDPGALRQLAIVAAHTVGFRHYNAVALSHFDAFEALSLQHKLTAYWFVPPVLNLWDRSRRPRIHFPADG